MLSPDTDYVCYLVFKVSEKCHALLCPVKVRDVLHQENNKAEFVYFITPSPLNINGITRVPIQREDGWMEIQVWKFNSTHEFKDDSLSMNMKFTCHEGTMSGLIVCGIEFRPELEVKIDGLPLLLDSLWTESDKKRKSGGFQSHFFSKREEPVHHDLYHPNIVHNRVSTMNKKLTEEAGIFSGHDSFGGHVNHAVTDHLDELSSIAMLEPYKHKCPYDWRTKKPTISREQDTGLLFPNSDLMP
ncbi:kinase-like domain, phloem protein 2-like protein [Tanacetum coccineum]